MVSDSGDSIEFANCHCARCRAGERPARRQRNFNQFIPMSNKVERQVYLWDSMEVLKAISNA
jgi:hypothetical protein